MWKHALQKVLKNCENQTPTIQTQASRSSKLSGSFNFPDASNSTWLKARWSSEELWVLETIVHSESARAMDIPNTSEATER